MRIGNNPSNNNVIEDRKGFHRVIIPVYIPHENEYFKDAFQIFNYCLFSLKKTSNTQLKISVVSNGSCDSINEKLYKMFAEKHFDEFIIEREGIGKINSVLKGLRTADERFITITDADVLFENGWEENVLAVFRAFPKAGAVCPVPVFGKQFQLTGNIWFNYLFSNKLKFTAVKNPEAMTKFANSIGWPWLDEKFKDVYATLKATNGTMAMVGCSHFVATYKSEVFTKIPDGNTEFKIRGDSEYLYTDLPVIKKGGYRLSTIDNYAYHMGNVMEDWMISKFENLNYVEKVNYTLVFQYLKKPILNPLLLEKIFKAMISIKYLKIGILKMKGLSNSQVQNFIS